MDLATLIHAMDLSDPVDRLALADLMADLGRTEEESLLRDMDFVIVWDDEAIGFRMEFYRRVCREPAIRQVTDPDGVVTLVEVTEGG